MTFFNVIQNRYEYIKLNYPNVACEVLEPLLRVTWIDVDYLMNNSNEIFYEPFTFEKYLMISKYCNTKPKWLVEGDKTILCFSIRYNVQ